MGARAYIRDVDYHSLSHDTKVTDNARSNRNVIQMSGLRDMDDHNFSHENKVTDNAKTRGPCHPPGATATNAHKDLRE